MDQKTAFLEDYNKMFGGFSDRDSTNLAVEGSLYLTGRGTSHSLDFGASRRRYRVQDAFAWPGPRQAFVMACENVGACEAGDAALEFGVNAYLDHASRLRQRKGKPR